MRVFNAHHVGKDVPGAIYIGRPSPFGNPFKIGPDGTRSQVIGKYRAWLNEKPRFIARMRDELKGKDLICWCAPNMCHGHVIRDVVLGPEAERSDLPGSSIRIYDPADVAQIYKTKDRFGLFANMKGGMPLSVNGSEISGSEAFYQALRFPHRSDVQEAILHEDNQFTAKRVAYTAIDDSREDWMTVRIRIMRFILECKTHEYRDEILHALGETRDMPIVEKSLKDADWGAMPWTDHLAGRNILGRLWMDIRARLEVDPDYLVERVEAPDMDDLMLFEQPIEAYTRTPKGAAEIQNSFDF